MSRNTVIIETVPVIELWARATQVGKIINRKSPYKFLADFRAYCEKNPKVFEPHKPMLNRAGSETEYNILCVAYFHENKHLLEAGIRTVIPFYRDMYRLRECYCMANSEAS